MPVARTSEEKPVRALMNRFVALYNAGDAEDIALLYTDNGHRFDDRGAHAQGRDAVRAMYEQEIGRRAVRRNPPDAELSLEVDFILLVAPGRALVDGLILFRGKRRRFTVVAAQKGPDWRLFVGRVHPPATLTSAD